MFFKNEQPIGPQGIGTAERIDLKFSKEVSPKEWEALQRDLSMLNSGEHPLQKSHIAILQKRLIETPDIIELSKIQARLIANFISMYGYGRDLSAYIHAYFAGIANLGSDYINEGLHQDNRKSNWEKGAKALYRFLSSRVDSLNAQMVAGKLRDYTLAHQGKADVHYGIDVFEVTQVERGENVLRLVQIESTDHSLESAIEKHRKWVQDNLLNFRNQEGLQAHLFEQTGLKDSALPNWAKMYEDEMRQQKLTQVISDMELIQVLFGVKLNGSNDKAGMALFEELGGALFFSPQLFEFLKVHIKSMFDSIDPDSVNNKVLANMSRAETLLEMMKRTTLETYLVSTVLYEGTTGRQQEIFIKNEDGTPFRFFSFVYDIPQRKKL